MKSVWKAGFLKAGLALAFVALVSVAASDAFARAGRSGSFGSRGTSTFSAPPSTRTAPNAAPIERSMTQPARPNVAANAATAGATGGLLGRPGFLGGLATGLLGAGLFGLLAGHGFLGGLGGIASFIGLMLQVALIVVVARLAFAWWQRRQTPAFAGNGPSPASLAREQQPQNAAQRSATGFGLGGGGPRPLQIDGADFDVFEQRLSEVQKAYSEEDLGALRRLATPEMVSYFAEDLAEQASRGVVNRVSDVKLEQGDLAEAWREGEADYATVAMRFSLVDQTLDRASGRVVEGSATPSEATELWTFVRYSGGTWLLSAIQQARA